MPLKVPMPDPTELEERFAIVLERFQVKNPPHTYIQKLRGYLDPRVTRKVSIIL
ncbi:unnamed protein product [Leuciscus chuanchicus]